MAALAGQEVDLRDGAGPRLVTVAAAMEPRKRGVA